MINESTFNRNGELVRGVYIPSRTPKRHDVALVGGKVIIRKLEEAVPHKVTVFDHVPVAAAPTTDSKEAVTQVSVSTNIPSPQAAPITASGNFQELKAKVEAMRKQEEEKKAANTPAVVTQNEDEEEDNVPVVVVQPVIEAVNDIEELVNGTVTREEDSVNMALLKTMGLSKLKNIYRAAYGEKATTENKFELRKLILEKYSQLPASKKKVIIEATKL